MKKTRIKPISDKRQEQWEEEVEIRRQLCERAGGFFVTDGRFARCIGGLCELCGKAPDWRGLHPHEDPPRVRGGKVSLKDSRMACGKCHSGEHGIKEVNSSPRWSKEA